MNWSRRRRTAGCRMIADRPGAGVKGHRLASESWGLDREIQVVGEMESLQHEPAVRVGPAEQEVIGLPGECQALTRRRPLSGEVRQD